MTSSVHCRVLCTLLWSLLAIPASAQVVRGRVVDADNAVGVVGALVELRDSTGVTQTVTRGNGAFVVQVPAGRYRYRVLAIGFLPRHDSPITVPETGIDLGTVPMQRAVVSLPELVATSKKRYCGSTDREDPAFARLLESVQTALAVMEGTVASGEIAFDVVYTHSARRGLYLNSQAKVDTVFAPMRRWPVRSLAIDSLQRFGFSRLYTPYEGVGRWYFGPDLRVLFSDWFLDSHCFTLAIDRGKGDTLRLRFQPAGKSGNNVDIKGELVIDRDSLSLHRLDFSHENLPFWIAGQARGSISFERQAKGLWIPTHWSVQAPIEFWRRGTRQDTMTIEGATVQLARVPFRPVVGRVEDAGSVVEVRAGSGNVAAPLPDVIRIDHSTAADSGRNKVTAGTPPLVETGLLAPDHHPDATTKAKAQLFPVVEHPGGAFDIPTLIAQQCPVNRRMTPDSLRRLEAIRNEAVLRAHPPRDTDWLALGCVRAHLSLGTSISREGAVMLTGTSWAQGAINALLEALALSPGEPAAAEALSILAMQATEPEPLNRIAAAVRDAIAAGVRSPGVLRACTELAMRRGDDTGARSCADRALALGLDSTWQLVRLSRLDARAHDSVTSQQLFVRAAEVARDSFARAEIDWHFQWFLSPEERKTWTALPDSLRGHWVRDRLVERDVRDGQPAGARLAEHFKRLEYVEENFRLKVPRMLKNSMRTCCLREYIRWQVDFDDRGVVYMRFGPPDRRAADVAIWKYVIDGRSMFVQFKEEDFDGSSGETRLDLTEMGPWWCELDEYRCFLYNRVQAGGGLTPEMRAKLDAEDRAFISEVTTGDDNSPRGMAPIQLVARLHRLWDPVTLESIALVSYAIGVRNLGYEPDSSVNRAPIDLRIRQWAPGAVTYSDTSVYQLLEWPAKHAGESFATGYLVVTSSDSTSGWSMTAEQKLGHGRAWEEGKPPLSDGQLGLSDLVIGVPGQGLVVKTGAREIVLAPLNTVAATDTVHLFYQVNAAAAHSGLHTTVAIYSLDKPAGKDLRPEVQIESTDAAQAGLNEVERTIGLTRLAAGRYRLEVTISDEKRQHLRRQVVLLEVTR